MGISHEVQPDVPPDVTNVGAVVVAAGESRRMKGIDKIFHPLNGKPLVWHSVSVLQAHPRVKHIVLVISKVNIGHAEALVAERNAAAIVSVCEGGRRRQDSVLLGLERLGDCGLVIVHDGARPFISAELLDKGISIAEESGAAIAAVPVKDTIKKSGKQSDQGDIVTRTVPRDRLWAAQTPQIFRTSLLREAHRRVSDAVTDDASMVEAIGHPIRLFFGSYYNIKVTTPEDLTFAQAIFNLNAGASSGSIE